MRPTTPPNDPAELLLYDQYNLATGSALFGLFGEGFMLCACLSMWGFWNVKHVKKEPWGIQLLAHYQVIACLASAAYWFHLFLDLFVYSPDPLRTLAQGDLVRGLYIVELFLTMPIEVFYVYRCWQVWGKRLWILVCFLLALGATVSGAIYLLSRPGLDYFEFLSGPGFWVSTSFHSTRRLVSKVIVWSAEVQLLPSCLAVAVILKTAIKPNVAISALYGFLLKFETVTFFVVLIAKQVIRDQALQQQAENQMNLDIMQELTEPEGHCAFRASMNGLACSLPFIGGSRSSKRGQESQLEAGLSTSQSVSLPTLPAKGQTKSFVPDCSPEEGKDLVVSDFAVHITGDSNTTHSSPIPEDKR